MGFLDSYPLLTQNFHTKFFFDGRYKWMTPKSFDPKSTSLPMSVRTLPKKLSRLDSNFFGRSTLSLPTSLGKIIHIHFNIQKCLLTRLKSQNLWNLYHTTALEFYRLLFHELIYNQIWIHKSFQAVYLHKCTFAHLSISNYWI